MKKSSTELLKTYLQCWKLARNGRVLFSTKPSLTPERYNVQRGNFASLTEKDFAFFEGLLGKTRVLRDMSDVEPFNIDWLNSVRGSSHCVLKPKTTQEVSTIMCYCNDRQLAICPQGGNTGLVGGSNPVFDEVVVSTSLMDSVIGFDSMSGVLTCQAGCVLERLDSYVQDQGHIMPLDLGAKGSCHIGGNVSTNAGGLRLVRYGSLHGSVLGIEAVSANGEIIDCISSMKKDNTGYHLKHLFIGSEGTLGFVTKVAIQCPVRPNSVNVAFLGLESFEHILKMFKSSKQHLGEILSSCEMMDEDSLNVVKENLGLRIPIRECPFYMLIETSGSNSTHDEEKLTKFLENALDSQNIIDGTVATEPSKIRQIFEVRERIAEALLVDGHVFMYDISLKLTDFYSIVPIMRERLRDCPAAFHVNGCGHLGIKLSWFSVQELWELRESITEGLRRDGYVYKYDISIPHIKFYDIVKIMRDRLSSASVLHVCGYGHVGDGNLHLNITCKEYNHELQSLIEPFVFEWTSKVGGSISAEHGIGFKKTGFIHFSKSPEALNLMHQIKKVMDPNGILNPYKVLPQGGSL